MKLNRYAAGGGGSFCQECGDHVTRKNGVVLRGDKRRGSGLTLCEACAMSQFVTVKDLLRDLLQREQMER